MMAGNVFSPANDASSADGGGRTRIRSGGTINFSSSTRRGERDASTIGNGMRSLEFDKRNRAGWLAVSATVCRFLNGALGPESLLPDLPVVTMITSGEQILTVRVGRLNFPERQASAIRLIDGFLGSRFSVTPLSPLPKWGIRKPQRLTWDL